MRHTRLTIQLNGRPMRPPQGALRCASHFGGPDTLLAWLEQQLGLSKTPASTASRVAQFASTLGKLEAPAFKASLDMDRWGTAHELLGRREELRLAGWDGQAHKGLPPMIQDLARVENILHPDQSDRLDAVFAALEDGQRLPDHECVLLDPTTAWPSKWQRLFSQLTVVQGQTPDAKASVSSSLSQIQRQALTGQVEAVRPDPSLMWLKSPSVMSACEAIAIHLKENADHLKETLICCENETAALALDGALHRAGLPTMGVHTHAKEHPALQVLPLALRLCWGPVDPSLLMDFLSLPICPIRAAWARPLREALAEQPGLGSSAWEEAKAKIFEADTEGEAQKRISQWLELERPTIGQPLPASLVKARCRLVSQWATGRAQLSKETPELNQSLLIAAGQAAELGELVEAQGGSISEPQLLRMLASVTGVGIPIQAYPCQAGGPTWVQSLAEIQSGCKRLIWMGLGTRDSETCRWTPSERLALQVVGIHLDDGSQRAKSLRNAERAGLCQVQDTLLAIALPGDEELRPHPVWLQIKAAFEVAGVKHPLQLQSEDKTLDALNLPTQSFAIQPALPPRTTWPIPAGLLADRQKSSASELEKRLSCPLAWVFTYAAQIKASPTARIPDDFRLKGSFAHQVLERVFKEGEDFQDTERAVKTVIAAFEARLPLDAAPLAQPHQIAEKQRLKKDLEHSTRALCKLIQKGGYKVVGFEVNIEGQIGDRELKGSIDCVLQDEDGQEALLDFKYGGLSKYKGKLEEGRATQLATYASARACAHGSAGKTRHPITGVAYLILSEGRVITPEGSPISGASAMEKVPGPAIREVWTNFLKALQGAEAWLRGEEAVPVRPLQSPQEWPEGADMVLKDPAKDKKDQEACRYCDYTSLCGKKELR